MVGVIWFVQVVHYPLFKAVSHDSFAAYHAQHTQRTGWVVIGPMLIELVLAFVLFSMSPAGTTKWAALAGMIILIGIWASTFLSQVPAHKQLAQGFAPKTWRYLLRWNWIRTVGWTVRLPIAAWMTYTAYGLASA
ncbi:MAG: hypothetical protein CMH56_10925 [Myxococcales bacterium]|nr:hypothetical protein [Myxococcales bacterium]|tara:strand:+ start:1545 stop:1949 length:405 start_codon:yes stop_codon:yes gene_type:complete